MDKQVDQGSILPSKVIIALSLTGVVKEIIFPYPTVILV